MRYFVWCQTDNWSSACDVRERVDSGARRVHHFRSAGAENILIKPGVRVNVCMSGMCWALSTHASCVPDVAFDLLDFCRTASSRNISKLSRYALQAIVIPHFYTRKVGLSEES